MHLLLVVKYKQIFFTVADVKKNFYFCNGKILIVKEKCIG